MLLPKTLWIVEDCEDLHPIYKELFADSKIAPVFFQSFKDFKERYLTDKKSPDLVLVDLSLQDGSFFQSLNDSNLKISTPIIVVSASSDRNVMMEAYDTGVIDYILKPINLDELKIKVERHLTMIEEKIIKGFKTIENLRLDLDNFTNKEIKIIESFNIKDDKTLHRNEITKIIWRNITIHPNTLDVHIYNLRKKLKKFGYTIKAIGSGVFQFMEHETEAI